MRDFLDLRKFEPNKLQRTKYNSIENKQHKKNSAAHSVLGIVRLICMYIMYLLYGMKLLP